MCDLRPAVPPLDLRPAVPESDILALQAAMVADPGAFLEGGRLVDPHEVHTFLPGLYVRQVTNEAGSWVVTMKHRYDHPFFVIRGHLRVLNLVTGEEHELRGGDHGVTTAGTQRAIVALEETVFITVHPNPDNCQDLEELERRLIVRQELPGGATVGELYREKLGGLLREGGSSE